MAKLSTVKTNAINTLFAAGNTDAEVVKEMKVAMSTVKSLRMAFQAEQMANFNKPAETKVEHVETLASKAIASHYQAVTAPTCNDVVTEAPKALNKMEEMAAKAKQAAADKATKDAPAEVTKPAAPVQPTLTPEQQAQMDQMLALQAQLMESGAITKPAPTVRATRTKQDPKDLTKRDVVAVVSERLKQCYICTTLKYSATVKGGELLQKDMLKRASLVELANADDFQFLVVNAQVEHTEAQTSKLRAHLAYEAQGFTMKSTKGRGQEVKDILAKLQAETTPAAVTATPVTVAA